MKQAELILVLDFGSPDSQVIARKVREYDVYCEIKPYFITLEEVEQLMPKGIILAADPKNPDAIGKMDFDILSLDTYLKLPQRLYIKDDDIDFLIIFCILNVSIEIDGRVFYK